jgi:hypothetical protein
LAVSRGRECGRSLLVTPRCGGRDKLMVPPFAAKAEPGSSAAITMHNTKRMMHPRFRFSR